jgi:hypothetical protein
MPSVVYASAKRKYRPNEEEIRRRGMGLLFYSGVGDERYTARDHLA